MASDNVIMTELYNTVEKSLSNKANVIELRKYMQDYFDRNSEKLFQIGPVYQIYFTDDDKGAVYKVIGLTPEQISATLKKSDYISSKWKIMNNPFNTAMCLVIRYFELNKMKEELELSSVYFTISMYPSLFSKYFKYGTTETIMAYTINNLSNKYIVKQLGSLFKMLRHNAITSHETYTNEIKRGNDGDLAKYVNYYVNRLNAFIKKIAREYYDNDKEKKYMNLDRDNYSEDNFHIADNNSYAIRRMIDSTMIRLSTYGPNMQYVKLAANMNNVSEIVFRNAINNIVDKDSESIQQMISLLIDLYLSDTSNKVEELKSTKFVARSLEIYKKSNTNDVMVLKIKELLDKWLRESSEKYSKTQREATLSAFRKALFTFFIFTIQDSSTD